MSNANVTLRIAIRDDADRNAGSIEIAAREYTAQLLGDLALPARAAVSIDVVAAGLADGCFSLTLDGGNPIVVCATGRTIDAEIPLAIYSNRRAFVSKEVVAAYANELSPSATPPAETLDKLQQLLLAAVDRNISLRRIAAHLPTGLGSSWKVFTVLSRIHTDDTVSIAVAGATGNAAQAWKTLQERVFEITGLLCPIPVATDGRHLSEGEYQVRLNDVHLPVQTAGVSVEEELVPFLEEALVGSRIALVTCDSLRRRVEFVDAPVLGHLITNRIGMERLWTCATAMVQRGLPVRDFRALLQWIVQEMARFRDEPAPAWNVAAATASPSAAPPAAAS